MRSQVIKFVNGGAATLRSGPFDLRKLGETTMHRSSEIEFDDTEQMFYVRLMEPSLLHMNESLRTKFFDTYELAVDHEIMILNKARKSGEL